MTDRSPLRHHETLVHLADILEADRFAESTGPQDFAAKLASGVDTVLSDLEAENARWKLHAERWEEVARNLGQVLAIMPAPLNDTFRKICLVHEVTP